MSFRTHALLSAVALLGVGSLATVSAQPQAPVRPRYGAFNNAFSPRPALGVQGAGAGNMPFINPIGPQTAGSLPNQRFAVPGQSFVGPDGVAGDLGPLGFGQTLPGAFATPSQLPASGVVGSFNNLGHWYGGNLGHWYPGGFASGRGAGGGGLGGGIGGGGGMGGVGGGVGPMMGGGAGGMARPGGSIMGTALGAGAATNMLRR